ncbi:hypothetical protein ACFYWH_44200, partial [Streptomyces sp. NPDC003737]|uniref:hypothetical protein n=1 Tax=Streptomyces sp. NPDC003737 TaxID=3364685 RepID=UPI0036AB54DB
MQDPIVAQTYQSSFATYTRTLDPSLLAALRINESIVLVVEAIVSLCKALTNDSDPRPWQERVEDCFSDVTEERLLELVSAFVEECESDNPQRWVDRFKNENYKRFTERLLG